MRIEKIKEAFPDFEVKIKENKNGTTKLILKGKDEKSKKVDIITRMNLLGLIVIMEIIYIGKKRQTAIFYLKDFGVDEEWKLR